MCVLFNNLINIHMYCTCTMKASSSWRSLWSLQQVAWILWCQRYRLLWVPHLCRHIWRLPRILCLLAWLFSLMFAASHRRMCVPSLQLLAETPYDPWSGSSCYNFISLMSSPLSLRYHRCMACMSCSPQLQLLRLQTHVHTEERAPSPRRVWNGISWEDGTDCADEVQDNYTNI